jgi:hypothetical protein
MDSFNTLMAVESDINSKYPKTVSLRKLLDKETEKVTFLWVPGHMGMNTRKWNHRRSSKSCPGRQKNTHHKIWLTGSKQKTRKQDTQDGKMAKTIWKIGKKKSNWIKTRKS